MNNAGNTTEIIEELCIEFMKEVHKDEERRAQQHNALVVLEVSKAVLSLCVFDESNSKRFIGSKEKMYKYKEWDNDNKML